MSINLSHSYIDCDSNLTIVAKDQNFNIWCDSDLFMQNFAYKYWNLNIYVVGDFLMVNSSIEADNLFIMADNYLYNTVNLDIANHTKIYVTNSGYSTIEEITDLVPFIKAANFQLISNQAVKFGKIEVDGIISINTNSNLENQEEVSVSGAIDPAITDD